jgi:small nuclear ribonucleoprotein (snRNP)-like protein
MDKFLIYVSDQNLTILTMIENASRAEWPDNKELPASIKTIRLDDYQHQAFLSGLMYNNKGFCQKINDQLEGFDLECNIHMQNHKRIMTQNGKLPVLIRTIYRFVMMNVPLNATHRNYIYDLIHDATLNKDVKNFFKYCLNLICELLQSINLYTTSYNETIDSYLIFVCLMLMLVVLRINFICLIVTIIGGVVTLLFTSPYPIVVSLIINLII